SLESGKDGQNDGLAAKLTGWRIDIKPTVEGPHPSPPPQAGEGDSTTTPQAGEGASTEAGSGASGAASHLRRLPPGEAQVGPAPRRPGRWDDRGGSRPGRRAKRLPVPRGDLLGPGAEAARARSRSRLAAHGPRLGAASSGNNDVSPPPGGRTQ